LHFFSISLRPAGIQPTVPYEMFVFWRHMLGQLGDKVVRIEQCNVLLPVLIILHRVNNRPVGSCIDDLLYSAVRI
jgi:hypothetical protein